MHRTVDLISVFRTWTIPTWDEKNMQSGIEIAFRDAGIEFEREAKLSLGVIDFLVGTIGVECKLGGAKARVMEQLLRYACDPKISDLLLVTNIASHRCLHGIEMQGKPVSVYWISPF
jgi:hypothetical protein